MVHALFIKIVLREKEVVLAGQKLITYVYAVDKQPTGNAWYKTVENGTAGCENFRMDTAMCFGKYVRDGSNV